MNSMLSADQCSEYALVFRGAAESIAGSAAFGSEWICKSGLWRDAKEPSAVVLKLMKTHWSPDPVDEMVSRIGVFFSAWVDSKSLESDRLRYNLHALKLGQLPGRSLKSRAFAESFRTAFEPMRSRWPNVCTEFGPQTLFEGHVNCPHSDWVPTVGSLAREFIPVALIVDRLLAAEPNQSR